MWRAKLVNMRIAAVRQWLLVLSRAHMSGRTRSVRMETRTVEGAPVVYIRGTVDMGTAPQLRDALLDLCQGPGMLLIDLSQVPYMDSSGVGTMVYAKRACDRVGRPVVLIGMQPRVRSVFEITHLDRFFRIVDNVAQALAPGAGGVAAK